MDEHNPLLSPNGNVVFKRDFENRKRYVEREQKTEEIKNRIAPGYLSDICGFVKYCKDTGQAENTTAFLDYLYVSIVEKGVKKNTWEKRVVAIRKYLSVTYDLTLDEDVRAEIGWLRQLYQEDGREELVQEKGKAPVDKEQLLNIINQLDKRAKAVCHVALITANRPNEMVRLQIKHFDLDARMVSVYLRKQKKWHNKRLKQETVQAVLSYIQEYNPQPEDYLIGRVNKSGVYDSSPISETAYRKLLKNGQGIHPIISERHKYYLCTWRELTCLQLLSKQVINRCKHWINITWKCLIQPLINTYNLLVDAKQLVLLVENEMIYTIEIAENIRGAEKPLLNNVI